MNLETNQIMLSLLFGSIGAGLFLFGKKAGRPIHLVAGLALMVFPYFVSGTWAIAGIGAVLTVLPFLIG